MTQRNRSEFSLQASPLGFNYPPTQSPDVPGSCPPQAVLQEIALPYAQTASLVEEGPQLLGLASQSESLDSSSRFH